MNLRSLNPRQRELALVFAFSLVFARAHAQGFNDGSDGSYRSAISTDGSIHIAAGPAVTVNMPPDGIFKCTTITIDSGGTLLFNRNPLNTPVYLLATGDIVVNGRIDVSGNASPPDGVHTGAPGGPGGFDGGAPGWADAPAGAGLGPGAAKGASAAHPTAGSAGYGTDLTVADPVNPNHGLVYGSPLLIPLVGGSGGGGSLGNPGIGGAGGGGAILLASNTSITVNATGQIVANGPPRVGGLGGSGAGSAGAIRFVSPVVSGNGTLDAVGFNAQGNGRVRIDTLDRTNLNLQIPFAASSIGRFLKVFPDVIPALHIVKVVYKNAQNVDQTQNIPENASGPVDITLPFNAPAHVKVSIQPRNMTGQVPIDLVSTPDNGSPTDHLVTINGASTTPIVIDIDLVANTKTRFLAYTK